MCKYLLASKLKKCLSRREILFQLDKNRNGSLNPFLDHCLDHIIKEYKISSNSIIPELVPRLLGTLIVLHNIILDLKLLGVR